MAFNSSGGHIPTLYWPKTEYYFRYLLKKKKRTEKFSFLELPGKLSPQFLGHMHNPESNAKVEGKVNLTQSRMYQDQ